MSVMRRDVDHGYKALFSRIERARTRVGAASSKSPSHRISIGIHGDEAAISYDGTTESITVVEVAAIHEYGSSFAGHDIPERSFIRAWFDENQTRLGRELKFAEAAELLGHDPDAVKNLALRWAAEVRARIASRSGHLEPLKKSTIDARENAGITSETPLDATGQLVASISAMVDGEYVQ